MDLSSVRASILDPGDNQSQQNKSDEEVGDDYLEDQSVESTALDFNLLADSTDDALGFWFLVAKHKDNLQAQPEDNQHRKHRICATDILLHYNVARSNLFFLSNNFYSYSMENFKYSNCKNLRIINSFLNDTINY